MMNDKKIAIVGGGPGGLTLARLLQQKNIHATVYERDKDRNVRQQGATLDLHQDSGLKALEIAGLMNAFKVHYRPGADKMRITNKDAVIAFDDHLQKPLEDFLSDFFRPEIDRGPLRDILIDSLKKDSIVWDAQFVDMSTFEDGWQLHFKNGNSVYADIVIAADGAHSKLRKYVTNIQPIYSGITIIEGNIYNAKKNAPQLNTLLKGGKLFAFGDAQSIILSAKGDGVLSFYTGTKEQENWLTNCSIDFNNKEEVHHWFTKKFKNWSPIWNELFESDECYFIPRPMYHYPLDQHWQTLSNITMIGDAAHRMPPYAGEGVNMAMQDALELYETFTDPDYNSVKAAIEAYEKKMLLRASAITKHTLQQTEALHNNDSLEYMVGMFNQ